MFEPSPALLAVHTRRRLQELTKNGDVITKIVRRAWQVIRYTATQQLWLTRNDSLFQEHRLNRSEHLETIQAATRRQLDAPDTGLRLRVKTRTQGMAVDITWTPPTTK